MAKTIITGGTQAEEFVEVEGSLVPREPSVRVHGSGTGGTQVAEDHAWNCHDDGLTTVMRAGPLDLVVVRVLGAEVPAAQTLTGGWLGHEPAMLAGVRPI